GTARRAGPECQALAGDGVGPRTGQDGPHPARGSVGPRRPERHEIGLGLRDDGHRKSARFGATFGARPTRANYCEIRPFVLAEGGKQPVSWRMARSKDISPLSQVLARADAVADGAQSPDTIATGFPSLDRMLGGGMRRGDLVVLGGDVGSGKSAFALAVAMRVAQQRLRVTFVSGEMSTERVLERVLAIEGRVRVDDLRQGVPNDVARASVG